MKLGELRRLVDSDLPNDIDVKFVTRTGTVREIEGMGYDLVVKAAVIREANRGR